MMMIVVISSTGTTFMTPIIGYHCTDSIRRVMVIVVVVVVVPLRWVSSR